MLPEKERQRINIQRLKYFLINVLLIGVMASTLGLVIIGIVGFYYFGEQWGVPIGEVAPWALPIFIGLVVVFIAEIKGVLYAKKKLAAAGNEDEVKYDG